MAKDKPDPIGEIVGWLGVALGGLIAFAATGALIGVFLGSAVWAFHLLAGG